MGPAQRRTEEEATEEQHIRACFLCYNENPEDGYSYKGFLLALSSVGSRALLGEVYMILRW